MQLGVKKIMDREIRNTLLVFTFIIFATFWFAEYFAKEQVRLCIKEAIAAKYSVQDAKELCTLNEDVTWRK